MNTRQTVRLPRRAVLASLSLFGVLITGCSAAPVPRPTPTADGSVPSAPVPDDGISLAQLGFTHGPVNAWSLPSTTTFGQRIDQPNQLTMVITSPNPETIVNYLVRALPPAGFTVEHQTTAGEVSALIAGGFGWRGSVVGTDADRTLVTLQQQG